MQARRRASASPLFKRRPRRRVLAVCLILAVLVLLGLTWTEAFGEGLAAPARTLEAAVGRGLQYFKNALLGPVRVGIQIGHEDAAHHPEELKALRASTGAHARGLDEVDLNRAVAKALAADLEAQGIQVDLLSATPPPGYHADLVVSLHADSNLDTSRRGYKSAYFHPARNPLEPLLKTYLDRAYLSASGLPSDVANVSGSMNYYYAFNFRRFEHSIHPGTPAIIVELGYISNPRDRRYLSDPERPAAALGRGIVTYLRARGRLPREEELAGR